MVAPRDGVHCCNSDSARRYLLTHFDRFQALIFGLVIGVLLSLVSMYMEDNSIYGPVVG